MGASSCVLRNLIEELAPMGRSYGRNHREKAGNAGLFLA